MKKELSFVSVIIPCRNEEKYIKDCLETILNQTYPKDKIEILIVDGASEDKTREIVKKYSDTKNNIKLLDNPKKLFAAANNIGIKNAKGDLVMILGAHAQYPKDYIEKCVEYQEKYGADNVGGDIKAVPSKNTLIAKAIALSLGGRFGKGKEKNKEKIRWEDTVFGGCYKKEVFEKIGLFNESLAGSSDMDFNMRLLKNGGKILLISDLVVYYYPKDNLKDFFFHNIKDGIWAILPFKYTRKPFKARHYIPLIFFLTLPLSIWLYLPVCLYYSAKISISEKDIRLFFIMPLVFGARHIGYGFGSAWGLIKIFI